MDEWLDLVVVACCWLIDSTWMITLSQWRDGYDFKVEREGNAINENIAQDEVWWFTRADQLTYKEARSDGEGVRWFRYWQQRSREVECSARESVNREEEDGHVGKGFPSTSDPPTPVGPPSPR